MRFVLKLFDSIYFPHSLKAVEKLLVSYEDPDTEKVLEGFDKASLIAKDDLLKKRKGIVEGYLKTYGGKPPKGVDIEHVKDFAKEQTDKIMEIIEGLPEGFEIVYMTQTDVYKKSRRSYSKTEAIIKTLIKCNSLIPVYTRLGTSKKPTTFYVHLRGHKNDLVMPEQNFMNYTGNGTYYAGVVFERVYDYGDLNGMNEAIMKDQGLRTEGSIAKKPEPTQSFADIKITEMHPVREETETEDYIEEYIEDDLEDNLEDEDPVKVAVEVDLNDVEKWSNGIDVWADEEADKNA
jgi:hypothetical protein